MSTKIINKTQVHAEETTQKFTDAQYESNNERIQGSQPGTPVSSRLINTSLRQATLITSALIDALKIAVPNDNDLVNEIEIGVNTTFEDLVEALAEALVKVKVSNAVLADNVVGGALVDDADFAREAKQGFGLSLRVNEKLTFKGTWAGTYKNNDIIYYGTGTVYKGLYVVTGLPIETDSTAAGTLTITSGQNPNTVAIRDNLVRLTHETTIGTNVDLTKTNTINSNSTENQLLTAKGAQDNLQKKLPSGSLNDILVAGENAGEVRTIDKVSSLGSSSTDNELPSGKAVVDYVNARIGDIDVVSQVMSVSSSFTVGSSHKNKFIRLAGTSSKTITITHPTSGFAVGDEIHLLRAGSGACSIVGEYGVNILSPSGSNNRISHVNGVVTLKLLSIGGGSSEWVLFGAVS